MFWKKERAAVVEVETDQDRLRIVEEQYRAAQREYDEAADAERTYRMQHRLAPQFFVDSHKHVMIPVNGGQNQDAKHNELGRKREHAKQRFLAKMRERAEWRKRCGLIR